MIESKEWKSISKVVLISSMPTTRNIFLTINALRWIVWIDCKGNVDFPNNCFSWQGKGYHEAIVFDSSQQLTTINKNWAKRSINQVSYSELLSIIPVWGSRVNFEILYWTLNYFRVQVFIVIKEKNKAFERFPFVVLAKTIPRM